MNDYRDRIARSAPEQIRVGVDRDRLAGLDQLIAACTGFSVFDLGCHDGTVLSAFARAGASPLAGCDIHTPSLGRARERLPNALIFYHDLIQGAPSIAADVVLYLGVHHHLIEQQADADAVAASAANGAAKYMAVRAPIDALDAVHTLALNAGLTLWYDDHTSRVVSPLRVYRRSQRNE
ncbi:MAG: hypothetical protein R3C30_02365 [Hyphomonadaceae bacterium]